MTFVSYAQNFEDVMLWRALQRVNQGFYIDVGAAGPEEGSVTRAFYERGWRGINIEPEPDFAAALRAERPRDINLEVAAGARPGRAIIHRIAGTGLSTTHADVAMRHAQSGFATTERREVEVVTLADVWRAHAIDTVHFLKVDAEGAERDVLLGADLPNMRPWIIVIEATAPLSPQKITETFDDLILSAGYRHRWFDGVNAWYIASEHDDTLGGFFDRPPNAFDDFVSSSYIFQARRAGLAEARLNDTHAALQRSDDRIRQLDAAWHRQQIEHEALRASSSEMQTRIATLYEAQRGSEARLSELNESWHGQVRRAEIAETQVNELRSALDASHQRLQSLEAAIEIQRQRADAAEAAAVVLQERVSGIHRSAR